MGKEGRQAVRCADFAFAQFRFLKRLLLVHGHWYYVRVSTLVQYSFYKNVTFITPQLFYAIWNAFSTQVRGVKESSVMVTELHTVLDSHHHFI